MLRNHICAHILMCWDVTLFLMAQLQRDQFKDSSLTYILGVDIRSLTV